MDRGALYPPNGENPESASGPIQTFGVFAQMRFNALVIAQRLSEPNE